jgi:hypothetical protein
MQQKVSTLRGYLQLAGSPFSALQCHAHTAVVNSFDATPSSVTVRYGTGFGAKFEIIDLTTDPLETLHDVLAHISISVRRALLLAHRYKSKRTPLHEAALVGNMERAAWLMEQGALSEVCIDESDASLSLMYMLCFLDTRFIRMHTAGACVRVQSLDSRGRYPSTGCRRVGREL